VVLEELHQKSALPVVSCRGHLRRSFVGPTSRGGTQQPASLLTIYCNILDTIQLTVDTAIQYIVDFGYCHDTGFATINENLTREIFRSTVSDTATVECTSCHDREES
jgi:hypothetical protein